MFQKMTLHALFHSVQDLFNSAVVDDSCEILRMILLVAFARRLSIVKAGYTVLPFSLMK